MNAPTIIKPEDDRFLAVPAEYAHFPEDFLALPIFLVYSLEPGSNGRTNKIPRNPKTGYKANDVALGVPFHEAYAAKIAGNYSGVGFYVISPYIVIDIDNCVDQETGDVSDEVTRIALKINSLTHGSQSGTGIHIVARGKKPGTACRKGIEMYDRGRFMTMEGAHVSGTPLTIEDRTEEIREVYDEMVRGDFVESERTSDATDAPTATTSTAFDSIHIQNVNGRVSTNKFELFMHGTISGDKPFRIEDNHGNFMEYSDRSGSDLGFCFVAACRYGNEPDAIWNAYKESSIYRAKEWGEREDDFRRLTIANAVASAKAAGALPAPIIKTLDDSSDTDSDLPLIYRAEDAPEDEEESTIAADDLPDNKWFFKGKLLNFSNEALYGITGDIIRKLHPQTESHPAGNLLDLYISLGSVIGRTAHYVMESTSHFCNEFGVRVGKSAKSRKGTGGNHIRRIMEMVDHEWCVSCNAGGLGSGEVMVHKIRDERRYVDAKGKSQVETGVDDKRLHISEGEFASILVLLNKKDSRLSVNIRDGWDGRPLRNDTKGEGKQVCLKPHVSIMADATSTDVVALTMDKDKKNGCMNRFLWCLVERTKMLPHGGEELDWTNEVGRLLAVISKAQLVNRVFMTANARRVWTRQYPRLTADIPGVLGAVTSRAEAHCLRIALLLALLDESAYEQVEPEAVNIGDREPSMYRCRIHVRHLKAAFAFWEYCLDSARLVFGGETDDQEKILTFIVSGPKPLTEIVQKLFHKHRRSAEVKSDLDRLIKLKKVIPPAADGLYKLSA